MCSAARSGSPTAAPRRRALGSRPAPSRPRPSTSAAERSRLSGPGPPNHLVTSQPPRPTPAGTCSCSRRRTEPAALSRTSRVDGPGLPRDDLYSDAAVLRQFSLDATAAASRPTLPSDAEAWMQLFARWQREDRGRAPGHRRPVPHPPRLRALDRRSGPRSVLPLTRSSSCRYTASSRRISTVRAPRLLLGDNAMHTDVPPRHPAERLPRVRCSPRWARTSVPSSTCRQDQRAHPLPSCADSRDADGADRRRDRVDRHRSSRASSSPSGSRSRAARAALLPRRCLADRRRRASFYRRLVRGRALHPPHACRPSTRPQRSWTT